MSRIPRVAFYAPMKSPDHAIPSGDREIARLTIRALKLAGCDVTVVSDLRTWEGQGDTDAQRRIVSAAATEVERIAQVSGSSGTDIWYTYHCYYKAPDLLGPEVSDRLSIPYVIAEPSISARRRNGPWADFAAASDAAIAKADRLLWTTKRDCPALQEAGCGERMVHFPAFTDPGDAPTRTAAATPLRLVTVAMMRDGDKLESYCRLARALEHVEQAWSLTVVGDGPAQEAVRFAFQQHNGHVIWHGREDNPLHLRNLLSESDVFVWPGVGEGVGMVYLEAMAAGLPVAAESHPSQLDLVPCPLANPDGPAEFAALIESLAKDEPAGARARAHVVQHHSIQAAAQKLNAVIGELCT